MKKCRITREERRKKGIRLGKGRFMRGLWPLSCYLCRPVQGLEEQVHAGWAQRVVVEPKRGGYREAAPSGDGMTYLSLG